MRLIFHLKTQIATGDGTVTDGFEKMNLKSTENHMILTKLYHQEENTLKALAFYLHRFPSVGTIRGTYDSYPCYYIQSLRA